MKRIGVVLTAMALMSSLVFSANATAMPDEQIMKNELMDRGLPSYFVDTLFENEIQKLYDETTGMNLTLYETAPDVEVNAIGEMTTDLRYVISSYSSGYIKQVYVYYEYEWDAYKPAVKDVDTVSINWNEDVFLFSSRDSDFELMQYYSDSDGWHVTDVITDVAEEADQGIAFEVPLDAHYTDPIGGRASFVLHPTVYDIMDEGYGGTRANTRVSAEYYHLPNDLINLVTYEIIDGVNVEINVSEYLSKQTDSFLITYYME